jgi:hypothetical protein
MECTRCGAPVEPSAVDCTYCGAPTPNAERVRAEEQAQKERAAAELAEGARREHAEQSERLEQTATRALTLSLVGMFICFIPVLQVIAVVSYLRARTLARQLSVGVPARATAGLLFSSVSLLLLVGGIVWAIVSDNLSQGRADERIAVLEAQARTGALQPSLDWATACALAEIHTLKDGIGSQKGKDLVHFDCVGKLTEQSGQPMLEHFSFRSDSKNTKWDVGVCFNRGAKWFVAEMSESHTCTPRIVVTPAAAAGPQPVSR